MVRNMLVEAPDVNSDYTPAQSSTSGGAAAGAGRLLDFPHRTAFVRGGNGDTLR
jgi:hypothetical protein